MTRYVPPSPDNVVSFGSGRGLRGANVQLEGPRPAVVQPMSRVIDSVDFRRPLLTKRERFLLGVALVLSLLALAGCATPAVCPRDTVAEREARLSEHARDWLEALRHAYECDLAKENVRRAALAGDEAALRENAHVWATCKERP